MFSKYFKAQCLDDELVGESGFEDACRLKQLYVWTRDSGYKRPSNAKGLFFPSKKNTALWITKSRSVQRKTSLGL